MTLLLKDCMVRTGENQDEDGDEGVKVKSNIESCVVFDLEPVTPTMAIPS